MRWRAGKFPLYVYIAAIFLGLMLLFAVISIGMQTLQTQQMMLSASAALFGHIDRETHVAVASRYDAAVFATDLLAETQLAAAPTFQERIKGLPALIQALKDQPSLSAAYAGYDNGDFFLVRPVASGSPVATSVDAPSGAVWLVQSVAAGASGNREGHYLFYDSGQRLIQDRIVPGYVFDPRTRPWFKAAADASKTTITPPYLFFTTKEAGTTFARRSAVGQSVIGVDLTLATLSGVLAELKPTPSAELVILNGNGEIVADANAPPAGVDTANARLGTIQSLGRPVLANIADLGMGSGYTIASVDGPGGTWQGLLAPLNEPGGTLYLVVAAPQSELLAQAAEIRNRSLAVAIAVLAMSLLFALYCSRLASRPLGQLTRAAEAIQSLSFDKAPGVHSPIAEVDLLARAMTLMKSAIRRFLDIGSSLANERNFDRLLERILVETIHLAEARGGAIYLAEPDGRLTCALARWDDAAPETRPPDLDPLRDKGHPMVRAATRGAHVEQVAMADAAAWYPRLGQQGGLTLFAVPLRNRRGEAAGALMLARDAAGADTQASDKALLTLVEALSGTAAAAIDSQRLIQEQKRLLESFIELLAGAIDRKSPYTGGHCERVPELTKMIVRAAVAAKDGPFKEFTFSEAEWEELHIAAWLHDCGKVTTPEYVVDKATKLETIYDRIHEIRMRFEVLKREAEVACWKAIAEGAPREQKLAELASLSATLDEEFKFVAGCNEGREFMAAEHIERLKQIARRQWTRTLDDRLGISEEEKRRKSRTAASALPVREPLLADRPDHVFDRREQDRLGPDNPWGFKIDVPEKLFDRGELYNLSIGRGTLTAEDRYKINEHMVETIRMLSRLPLPRHLSNVVEIAGGHHEKMDGTGYPRRLKREEMSVPARMMAIADIFEALTAADRPYKKAKPLSESLAIMARMRDDAHIDPDLFDLFLSAGVWRDYAERFLRPDQMDAVDPEKYRRRA